MGDGALRRRLIKLLCSYARVGDRTPCSVWGLALSSVGREAWPRHVVEPGLSPPRPRPDPVQPVCRPVIDSQPQAGSTTRPIAHRKAAISRAIAATATGALLPAAISRRYRALNRTWAFQAISRTALGRPSSRPRILSVTRAG